MVARSVIHLNDEDVTPGANLKITIKTKGTGLMLNLSLAVYLDFRGVATRFLTEAGRARAERGQAKMRLTLRSGHIARLKGQAGFFSAFDIKHK